MPTGISGRYDDGASPCAFPRRGNDEMSGIYWRRKLLFLTPQPSALSPALKCPTTISNSTGTDHSGR
jgi:hypothetical protein